VLFFVFHFVQNVEFQSNIKRDYFLELLRNSLCPIGWLQLTYWNV